MKTGSLQIPQGWKSGIKQDVRRCSKACEIMWANNEQTKFSNILCAALLAAQVKIPWKITVVDKRHQWASAACPDRTWLNAAAVFGLVLERALRLWAEVHRNLKKIHPTQFCNVLFHLTRWMSKAKAAKHQGRFLQGYLLGASGKRLCCVLQYFENMTIFFGATLAAFGRRVLRPLNNEFRALGT